MNGNGTGQSKNDRAAATRYWRPDLESEDSHAIVTTVQTQHSGNSSQEDLNPKQHPMNGVNVHKSFYVSSDEM